MLIAYFFIIPETKLDSTFPTSQFMVYGYSEPYRFDKNRNGGGVVIYIRENIPNKPLAHHKLPHDNEGIFVELNLRKKKWLRLGFELVTRGFELVNCRLELATRVLLFHCSIALPTRKVAKNQDQYNF